MEHQPNLIAIAYDLDFRHAAEIFSGASDYAQKHGLDWRFLPLSFAFEAKLMELAASGSLRGAIGTFVSDEWIRGLRAHHVATVNLFNFSRIRTVPTISLDDAAIGRNAAKHLREQGAKSLSFVSRDEAYFNQIRRRAFREACAPGTYHEIDFMQPHRIQAESLGALRPPVGVLCSNDRIARELCNEARRLGMEPGRKLLVAGIGNEPAESTFAGLGLSSFEIPAREMGYLAAETMATSLQKKADTQPRSNTTTLEAIFMARESTLSSPQARLVERAVALIEESIAQADLDVAYLSRRLGVSRRALELTTRQQLDKSPFQILSGKRLIRAKALLQQTKHPVAKIGEACGYPEPHHFSAWFKQRTGTSPKQFRLMHQ
jgi:DNA-binding LacI/PurR family transcriptional regulator